MVRLKDIAEACGVSVATVSRALNGLTNENKERTAFICQTARFADQLKVRRHQLSVTLLTKYPNSLII